MAIKQPPPPSVARLFELLPEAITSPMKYRHAVKARSVSCYWAIREFRESATALAKRLRLSQPAVSISVKRGERLVKEVGLQLVERQFYDDFIVFWMPIFLMDKRGRLYLCSNDNSAYLV